MYRAISIPTGIVDVAFYVVVDSAFNVVARCTNFTTATALVNLLNS